MLIATRYYLNTNPFGFVSLVALALAIVATVSILDEIGLPRRIRTVIKLLLPVVFVFGGIACTPHKFVTGEHIMGKIVCYVFCFALSLDLVMRHRVPIRIYGVTGVVASVILGSNMVYQLVILQSFYHVFSWSIFEIGILISLLSLNIATFLKFYMRERAQE